MRKQKPNHVILDSHSLEPESLCCVKFLSDENADISLATVPTTVDQAMRDRIDARLETRPDAQAVAVCRICKELIRNTPHQVKRYLFMMRLPEASEGIIWHFRSW